MLFGSCCSRLAFLKEGSFSSGNVDLGQENRLRCKPASAVTTILYFKKEKKTKYLAGVETPTPVPSYLKFMSRSPLPKHKYYSGKVVCLTHSHLVYIECLLEFNSLSYTFQLEAVPKISLSAPSEFFILGLILSPIDSIKL